MTYKLSKKKSLQFSLNNFWYSTRISLLVEVLVVGLTITFYFLGAQKSVFLMRLAIILFVGSIVYIVYLLLSIILMLIQLWKRNEAETMTLNLLENGELHFQYNAIDCILDRTKIKWVREHRTEIYFFIKISKRKQALIVLQNPIEDNIKNFILGCKENKGLKQPAAFVIVYFLCMIFGLIIAVQNTTYQLDTEDAQIYEFFQEHHTMKMLEELCPLDLISYTPTSQKYYYYNKKYMVFPTNPPAIGLMTFVYTPQDYELVKKELQSVYQKSEWNRNYKGTEFYIHPEFKDSNSYGFIGYNDEENKIFFLGYEEGYVPSTNPLESDFGEFIQHIYGSKYSSK